MDFDENARNYRENVEKISADLGEMCETVSEKC